MTPEQRKRVAEVVTGEPWIFREAFPELGINRHTNGISSGYDNPWAPDFNGQDWQRSQALAVVEWLLSRVYELVTLNHNDTNDAYETYENIADYVREKDIEPLLSLVLELSDE